MNQKDFGLRLKELRQCHNITQSQMAKKLKITRQAYSNYEQGRTSPSIETLAKLSVILDTNFFMYYMNQNTNNSSTINSVRYKKIDSDEFFSFFSMYSQLSLVSRSRLLNLMNLMMKGGE